ncbi:MAG: flagellar hook protein FlgE [Oceanococcaceae bacterium]
MSFNIALSGMNAATANLGVISNNIANANTTGFKSSRSEFADLITSGNQALQALDTGGGVVSSATRQSYNQGTIQFTDNAMDLAISGSGFFTINRGGVEHYTRDGSFQVNAEGFLVTSQGDRLQGFAPLAGGGFNTAEFTDLQLSTQESAPQMTSEVTAALNLPADAEVPTVAAFDPADPDSYNHATSVTVFDSLGAPHAATLYFSQTATENEWTMNVAIDGTDIGSPTPVTFDNTGAITAPAGGLVTFAGLTIGTGTAAQDISLDLSSATQFGSTFAVSDISQDGFANGQLNGVEFTSSGILQARYSNGQTVELGQVALSNFRNLDGLQAAGENAWRATPEAGAVRRGEAGTGDFGSLRSGALEASNVDLTEQLVSMITAQRSFQANSQVITTMDQITQAALQLR